MAHETYLTVSEAAATAGVSRNTLYRWMHEGRLVPVRVRGLRRIAQSTLQRVAQRATAVSSPPSPVVADEPWTLTHSVPIPPVAHRIRLLADAYQFRAVPAHVAMRARWCAAYGALREQEDLLVRHLYQTMAAELRHLAQELEADAIQREERRSARVMSLVPGAG